MENGGSQPRAGGQQGGGDWPCSERFVFARKSNRALRERTIWKVSQEFKGLENFRERGSGNLLGSILAEGQKEEK